MGRHPHRSRFGPDPDPDAVDRALARTGTEDLTERSIDGVSGGERQRAVIARALAQDAPALVLDEPTASLDVNHQVRTLSLVRSLVEEGRTAVAAIHDLDLAARFCDALVVLAEGRVLAVGSPAEVLTPSVVESAFDTPVAIHENPATGTPTVTAVSAPDRRSDPDAGR
jgi:iron complex transport system ATP-binding protein